MNHPYMQADLARQRQHMLMAEAEAVRRARLARSHRHRRGAPAIRRSPWHWIPDRLLPARSRLHTRPGSGSEATGKRGALQASTAVAAREVRRADAVPAVAEHTGLDPSLSVSARGA
jgi:hypothetical protein